MKKTRHRKIVEIIEKRDVETQEELAEALYVEKSIISYYENDQKEMRVSGLAEIAKVLQTRLIAL